MNAEDSLKRARRFIGLSLEKRQLFLQALQKEGMDFSRFPIPAGVEAQDRQALSYAQQRMWFLWQLAPASGAYNLPGALGRGRRPVAGFGHPCLQHHAGLADGAEAMNLALRITFAAQDDALQGLFKRVPKRPWYARHLKVKAREV